MIIIEPDIKNLRVLLENLGNFSNLRISEELEIQRIEIKDNEIVLLANGETNNIEPIVKWLSKYFGINVKLLNRSENGEKPIFSESPALKAVNS